MRNVVARTRCFEIAMSVGAWEEGENGKDCRQRCQMAIGFHRHHFSNGNKQWTDLRWMIDRLIAGVGLYWLDLFYAMIDLICVKGERNGKQDARQHGVSCLVLFTIFLVLLPSSHRSSRSFEPHRSHDPSFCYSILHCSCFHCLARICWTHTNTSW